MKPSELFCFKDTKNFALLLFFLGAWNKKIPVGKHDKYHVRWKWSTRRLVEDGMSTGVTNTHTARGLSDLYHVFARKQCMLFRALRHCCLRLYSMLHRLEILSAPGTIAHGSIRLPPRSLTSSRGCSLAINLLCALCFPMYTLFTPRYTSYSPIYTYINLLYTF